MFGVLFFVLGLACVTGQTTQVERCAPGDGDVPIHTYIEGCTTMPCNVTRGEDTIINVVFKAPHAIQSMRTTARVTLLNVVANYPLAENQVTCNYLQNAHCPLKEGEIVEYKLRVFLDSFFVIRAPIPVDFAVEDSDQNPIWCARVWIRSDTKTMQKGTSEDRNRPILKRFLFKDPTNF
ncbi:unnamed protein product [Colias eurytheme]|nr:unnamed protein product [Colias eurytheme]